MLDAHHILFNRQEWTLRDTAKKLRQTPSLVPRIDRQVHDELHRHCPPVPLLGHYALESIWREFYPSRDTLKSAENLMEAIEETKSGRFHDIERSLFDLAIMAIDLQRPYLIDGMPKRDY